MDLDALQLWAQQVASVRPRPFVDQGEALAWDLLRVARQANACQVSLEEALGTLIEKLVGGSATVPQQEPTP
jgi:hypothetical protein